MASTLTSYLAKNVTTAASTLKTVSAGTVVILVSMYIANTSESAIEVDVYVTRSGVDYYLAKGIPVPVGGALVPVSVGKVVLIASDALKIVSDTATSADAIVSALEKTTS
jgi:hypothetical protein